MRLLGRPEFLTDVETFSTFLVASEELSSLGYFSLVLLEANQQ